MREGFSEKMNIFIATHKPFSAPKEKCYTALHVGAQGKDSIGFLGDNTGDNISLKNSNYCELTGMYWIWKNCKESVVGLVHYRRYFFDHPFSDHIMNEDEIKKVLKKSDVIIAQRGYTWFNSVENNYRQKHTESDIELTRKAINDLYPRYSSSFEKVMKSNHYSQFNMMICRKEIFDSYCAWLFDVLGYVEKNLIVPLEDRTKYEKRVFGFLSERLLIVWLMSNSQYKVIEKPVFNTEESMVSQRLISVVKKVIGLFWK